MIKIANLSKSFGDQLIFDDVVLAINSRERLGLVGRNGHGKTTLFRILLGLEEADTAELQIPKNYRIGYLTQTLKFSQDTVLAEACLGLCQEQSQDTWRVEKILSGLGFCSQDFHRHPDEFSGGFQVRLNLAKVLVSSPDLLLLDEPTNYLDIVSIRWLADYLRHWESELCLITHDRSFMDAVVTHVAAIHRRKIRKYKGTTSKLYQIIEKEEEIFEKTRLNEEKKRKEAELYIARFRSKARLATNVQSRMKALAKKDWKEKLENIKNLKFHFSYAQSPARTMLSVSGLSFSYTPDRLLLRDFNLSVGPRDRICVIGHNGQGKTTLLKLLHEELTPNSGQISFHPKTVVGYFAQTNTVDLHPDWSIEEEFMSRGCEKQRARGIAGAMMFEGDMAKKKTAILSGGEKSRVLLGKVIAQPSNLLLLDEPTNHLDMQTCDSFVDAVDEFEGSVVMVTHNEMFLHRLANRFIVFQEDHIDYFEGSYQEFLDGIGWATEVVSSPRIVDAAPVEPPPERLSKKELRRLRAAFVARTSKELRPLEQRIEKLEKEIMSAEDKLEQLNSELIAASVAKAGPLLGRLSKEVDALKQRIDTWFEALEQVSVEHSRKLAAMAEETKPWEENM
jgi:ATP-binding cassette subfamily F protein 3